MWYQSIDNFKLPDRPSYFFHCKGTPSREEHKTVLSIFTTFESASTGWIGKIWSSVSMYSRSMVPRVHRAATVWLVPLPYIFFCWLAPIDGPTLSPYSHCMVQGPDGTVAVRSQYGTIPSLRCWRGTIRHFVRFMMTKFALVPDFKIVRTRT